MGLSMYGHFIHQLISLCWNPIQENLILIFREIPDLQSYHLSWCSQIYKELRKDLHKHFSSCLLNCRNAFVNFFIHHYELLLSQYCLQSHDYFASRFNPWKYYSSVYSLFKSYGRNNFFSTRWNGNQPKITAESAWKKHANDCMYGSIRQEKRVMPSTQIIRRFKLIKIDTN